MDSGYVTDISTDSMAGECVNMIYRLLQFFFLFLIRCEYSKGSLRGADIYMGPRGWPHLRKAQFVSLLTTPPSHI